MVIVPLTSRYCEQIPFVRSSCIAQRQPTVSIVAVSIIIPVYNRCDLTAAFVRNLAESTPGDFWEAVIVDDESTDDTGEFLKTLEPPFRSIRLETNGGYARSINRGAATTSAPVLAFLNNDLILSPGWLEPMMSLLSAAKDTGAVGNIQINPATRLIDHAGIFFDPEGMPAHAHKNRRNPPRGPWKERNAVTAACMVTKRYVFDTLNGFDERFRNGMEDIDFCVRMRTSGYRIFVSHESLVGHLVSSSPGRHLANQENIDLYRRVRAPSAADWGRREWPREYFRRYARHWWRINPSKALLALHMLVRQLIYHRDKKPID